MNRELMLFFGCYALGTVAGVVRQMAGPGDCHRKFDAQVVLSGLYSGFSSLSASIPARDYYKLSEAMTCFVAVFVALGGVETYNTFRGLIIKMFINSMQSMIVKGGVDDDRRGGGAPLGGGAGGPVAGGPGGDGGGGGGGAVP